MLELDNFIGGRFTPSSSSDRIEVRNPATGAPICSVPDSSQADLDAALDAATEAQRSWAQTPAIERAAALRDLAQRIRTASEEIARVIVEEQGKTLELARVEANFTADYIDYMSE